MIQHLKQRIPEKYRLITFLSVTSIIGVLLIFLAMYNAFRELEIIHEVDNLYQFTQANVDGHSQPDEFRQNATKLMSDDYQVLVLENNSVVNALGSSLHDGFPVDITELEQSRINDHGGYVEINDGTYTWVKLKVADSNRQIVLIHNFTESAPDILIKVFSKRLLIPGVLYVWLMVWVALIIRYLTDKLSSQNEALKHMALHDTLTGLPNRNLFEDRIHKLIQDCRRNQRTFALAVIDLNQFKEVNDTLGHDQGDELLRLIADRISDILRASDTAARMGGDEFILLLNDVSEETSMAMCERVKSAILRPYCLRDAEVNIGLSIGIAMFPAHGEESTTLMRNADQAMYTAKADGGGIHFHAGHQKVLNKLATDADGSST